MLKNKLLAALGLAGALLFGVTADASANPGHGPRGVVRPAPVVVVRPAPVVVVRPAPVYVPPPAPVVVAPAYVPPARVVVYPAPVHRGPGWRHHHHGRHHHGW